MVSESEFLMWMGSEFQRVGAAMAKAWSPKVRCFDLVMGLRRFKSAERRRREGLWCCKRSVRYGGAKLLRAL